MGPDAGDVSLRRCNCSLVVTFLLTFSCYLRCVFSLLLLLSSVVGFQKHSGCTVAKVFKEIDGRRTEQLFKLVGR